MPLVSKSFSDIITFTRASSGTYFDATGTLQTATTDNARFDYNPSTLAARGMLVEEQRTNSIRNNTMQGAVAGTPGTLPTNWSVLASGGLTTAVVGTGTNNGITYIDLRISGTSSTTFYVLAYDSVGGATTTVGQSWTSSQWIALVGGSTANISSVNNQTRQVGGAGPIADENMAPSSTFTRKTGSTLTTVTGVTSVTTCIAISMTSGAAIDITLRIGLPQLEQGAFATSVISTSTAAATRSADVASVNTLSPWYNASAGTVYVKYNQPNSLSGNRFITAFSDGTTSNRMLYLTESSPNRAVWYVDVSGSNQASVAAGSMNLGASNAQAATYGQNDFSMSVNGGAVVTDSSGNVPASQTTLQIGNHNSIYWNGWIQRITYYPRRLSNTELQGITA